MKWCKISSVTADLLLYSERFTVSFDDETFFDGNYIMRSFIEKYSNFQFPYIMDEPVIYLINMWESAVTQYNHELKNIFTALHSTYNPINNYDMQESEIIGRKQDKTVTTPNGENTSIYQSTTYDDTTFRDVDKTTETVKTTTTVEPSNTLEISGVNGIISGVNSGDTRILSRSGNIGVTTSQQMIDSELQLRSKYVCDMFIKWFINNNMFMAWDGEQDE